MLFRCIEAAYSIKQKVVTVIYGQLLSDSPKKAAHKKDLEILKLVYKYKVHKHNILSIREEMLKSISIVLNYPDPTEYGIRLIDQAFLYFLIAKLTNNPIYVNKAKEILDAVSKNTHCLFDAQDLRENVRKEAENSNQANATEES
jgi:hypothetical protein